MNRAQRRAVGNRTPVAKATKQLGKLGKRVTAKKIVMIRCDSHGDVPWQGHVVCDNCERVYQTSDQGAPNYAPLDCVCGEQLMPTPGEDEGTGSAGDFTARSVCPGCYAVKAPTEIPAGDSV